MLVLSRKVGQKICIGENIFISVVQVQGSRVRLAIEAPENVTIDRAEVRRRLNEFLDIPADCSVV